MSAQNDYHLELHNALEPSRGTLKATGLTFNTSGVLTGITATAGAVVPQVYEGRDPSAPDDPTKGALSYPTGGGDITQWVVATQAWI